MNQPMNILDVCRIFDVDPHELPDLRKHGPIQEIEKNLEKFKAIFKKAYRKLALECHPDKGASKQKIDRFKKATSMYKELSKIKVIKVPIRRPIRTVVIRTGGFGNASSSTTGNWDGGTWYWNSGGTGEY